MKTFTLLKSALVLAILMIGSTAMAQSTIFSETFGVPTKNTKIAAYTGWDNATTGVTFTSSNANADIRALSGNGTVWFPGSTATVDKSADITISGINTKGCTNMVLSFEVATYNPSTALNKRFKIKANNVNLDYNDISSPAGENKNVFVPIICTTIIPESDATSITFSIGTDNTEGWRIDNVKIMGNKPAASEPIVTVLPASIEFATTIASKTISQTITVTSEALTADLAIATSGEGFTCPTTVITKATEQTTNTLEVTFAPTAEKDYTGTITISGGGLKENVTIALSGKGVTIAGDGSKEKPYTVADVIKLNNSKEIAWVNGYIVGQLKGQVFETGAEFNPPFTKPADGDEGTNLLISDNSTETIAANCIPLQLPKGDIRTALNLITKGDNLSKGIAIKGSLDAYFGVTGVKSPTEYVLDPATGIISDFFDALRVFVQSGIIHIQGAQDDQNVEVYDMSGRSVVKTTVKSVRSTGINGLRNQSMYLVKVGNKVNKVALY